MKTQKRIACLIVLLVVGTAGLTLAEGAEKQPLETKAQSGTQTMDIQIDAQNV
jgi:hypothetical protein